MKKNKNKILLGLIILLTLGVAFWYGGNAPGLRGFSSNPDTEENIEGEIAATQTKEKVEERNKVEIDKTEIDKANEEIKEQLAKANEEIEEKLDQADKETIEKESETQKDSQGEKTSDTTDSSSSKIKSGTPSSGSQSNSREYSEEKGMEIDPDTGKDQYATDPVPEGKPVPVEPGKKPVTNVKKSATLSVRVDTLLNNLDVLPPNKIDLVPKDGAIYAATKVNFSEGESVFDLLSREMKKSKIHMEFSFTPMYNSAYIEGINNLYEFDGGELSGWMYKVNGWFPNYGASRYVLKEGDRVEWVYTLDLGHDVGGGYSTGGN